MGGGKSNYIIFNELHGVSGVISHGQETFPAHVSRILGKN